ncbi:histone [Candidatus Woesearchaeota archaeon CG_4_10_14_0_8_um_filter_47_5]|nr:MAG: histone [Candidatus Woesearchaeota archaeon CG_4_10_14_0_8_um_filter_47_5]
MSPRGIPLAAMEALMKKAGAERVSDDAKSALKQILETLTEQITLRAQDLASHAGRKTVKKNDIELAAQQLGPFHGK